MAIQSAGIDIKSSTIGLILQEKNLCVPLSQRSYRWETEHVDDLYKDINAALLAGLDEYFLGSVVVIKSQGNTCADGQREPQYIPNPGAEVTLEHILPARPGEHWKHMTPDEQKANLNRLGNQVLLSATLNSKVGNASFSTKKPALKASEFSLTREAAAFDSWGVTEIARRQDRLAELAVKTWPLR